MSFAVNTLPVLKADSIKYIMIFRSMLPQDMVVGSIPQLVRHLAANSQVVHTYAACAIEKILVMKAPDGSSMYVWQNIKKFTVKIYYFIMENFLKIYTTVCENCKIQKDSPQRIKTLEVSRSAYHQSLIMFPERCHMYRPNSDVFLSTARSLLYLALSM